MVSELEEVRAEVSALRDEVAHLRAETADTRVLAAMADRDAAGVRAALNGIGRAQTALRETQVEQGAALSAHGRMLREIAQLVGSIAEGQQRHDEMLTEILHRLPDTPGTSEGG
ncbi:MAG: hypothetical protein QG597_2637 [Actinomycetota bacterium]|nr:hypothetical protein [Actinomycetota bacterium]